MDKKIGFIGTGNMGGALIVAASRSIDPKEILVTDYYLDKAREVADKNGCCVASSNDELVENAEHIVLAVKPNIIRGVLSGFKDALKKCVDEGKKRVVVTIAAGVTVETIKNCLGFDIPVIRIMPSTPAMVGQSMVLLTCDGRHPDEISDEQFSEFQSLISAAGRFDRINENSMDAYGGVPGCTPAYAYMFIEAIADGAVQTGVPRDKAMMYGAQALLGAAAMYLETGIHPGALKDMVCSPGGSTIVGVTTLEQYGFRNAVTQAVINSTKKNAELGK